MAAYNRSPNPWAGKADSPEAQALVDAIWKRYPGEIVAVNGLDPTGLYRIDVETKKAYIEVKPTNGQGLTKQVRDRLNPQVNPQGKLVIGYAPQLGHAGESIRKSGGIPMGGHYGTLEDLLRLIAP